MTRACSRNPHNWSKDCASAYSGVYSYDLRQFTKDFPDEEPCATTLSGKEAFLANDSERMTCFFAHHVACQACRLIFKDK